MNTKIAEIEAQLADKLRNNLRTSLEEVGYSTPENLQLTLELLDGNKRKKRSDASAKTWSPQTGRIQLKFKYTETSTAQHNENLTLDTAALSQDSDKSGRKLAEQSIEHSNSLAAAESGLMHLDDGELALIRCLARAEATPGWTFVPLRKFRDEILAAEKEASLQADLERRRIIDSAVKRKLVLTGKVDNPKNPQFPVTTIRLNRLLPEVQRLLGLEGKPDLDFHPIEIRGEPLSETVLRERR
jgi:hypothetical protein